MTREIFHLVRDFFNSDHAQMTCLVWSCDGHVQSGLPRVIQCMFLIQTCARLLIQECMTAHLQAVIILATKQPLQLGEIYQFKEIFS